LGGICLVLASGSPLWAGELLTAPDDTPEADRWNTVVPQPVEAVRAPGVWSLPSVVKVGWGPVTGTEREDLADRLDRTLGPLGRRWTVAAPGQGADLRFEARSGPDEGYTLALSPGSAVLGSAAPAGRFYALVTLAQLLPPRARAAEPVTAACGTVTDAPALTWRGLMLDVSRHFIPVSDVEAVLELMALHKLNRFHWHLTDDQGWRFEVPGWPKLTEVGAWRTEGGQTVGGFYTAVEVRAVVEFAARRHIVVVPEVDMPGHESAALAAYPELSASGQGRDVPLDWGVADGVLSIGRPSVQKFTADVLATLTDLFPGPWIHWGGDEVYRTPWMKNPESLAWMKSVKASTADQALGAFWADLARRTLAAGRIPIGWDEVMGFPVPEGTVVQWWETGPRALAAFQAGRPVIASWKVSSYLDYPDRAGDADRAYWMPFQTLDTVADQPFWPPGTPDEAKTHLLGTEVELWAERVLPEKLGRKLFPRAALAAEGAWRGVPGGVPGWRGRIEAHRDRLEAWGVGMPPPAQ